jgi:DNA-cytosine methyltransferase
MILTHGSLFSGIGGFDLAAHWAGVTNLWACEIDPFNQDILKKRFPETLVYGDIRTADWQSAAAVDILSGGFPCQAFSTAGQREGSESEKNLWPDMHRVAGIVRPTWIVAENVPGLVYGENAPYFEQICADLEALEYEVWAHLIPACAFGTQHERYRLWIVANARIARCEDDRIAGRISAQDTPVAGSRCPVGWLAPWKDVARLVRGICHGVPQRLDRPGEQLNRQRLRSLGNAIVPQVAHYIFDRIRQCEA